MFIIDKTDRRYRLCSLILSVVGLIATVFLVCRNQWIYALCVAFMSRPDNLLSILQAYANNGFNRSSGVKMLCVCGVDLVTHHEWHIEIKDSDNDGARFKCKRCGAVSTWDYTLAPFPIKTCDNKVE